MTYQKDTSEKNIINNLTIALNVLYIKTDVCPANAAKHSSNCEKQANVLMIPIREEWYYVAVKITCII